MWIAGFLAVLGPLVTLHELGHYLVGRMFGVKAEAFSIGFGKELTGWTDSRGTRWKISALPLGGYVQFKGDMDPASIPDRKALDAMPEEERDGSFHHAKLWQRALIVFAGPATNILIAVAIFAAFFALLGKPMAEPVVTGFSENSVAEAAGVEVGDRIVAVDGNPVDDFMQVRDAVALYPGKAMDVVVERDGARQTVPLVTEDYLFTDRYGNEGRIGLLGVMGDQVGYEKVGAVAAVGLAAEANVRLVGSMIEGLRQIIFGERSVQELGGPLKIAKFSGERLSEGWLSFIEFSALISINLAFINLLPIPALDGGHLAFYAAEAVRRKPVGPRGTEIAYRTGIALVVALMVFVTINDVISLPIFG
ncbi:RIP metalloprotease RseP [Altererythrobacter sp. HHU K3-1]|uniref:Zinc metalloprotease n=2 Tax=Qipengyuania atrilutea TaxID=2744473 RepID=A0A850H259_9SPHN|nr:RIP metalloprotease RseP [Actirhodobacter atriluteus]